VNSGIECQLSSVMFPPAHTLQPIATERSFASARNWPGLPVRGPRRQLTLAGESSGSEGQLQDTDACSRSRPVAAGRELRVSGRRSPAANQKANLLVASMTC